MNPDELIALNEEIAGMARAGLPLDQGLSALAREMNRGRLRHVTKTLADDLRAGHTLPEALERQGNQVPPFYAGLMSAAVRSGNIGEVLATLTVYARTIAGLRSLVFDALYYPTVVLTFALILFSFLCYFVLPQFEQIFRDFGMRLPFMTEVALGIGRRPVELVLMPLGVIVGVLALGKIASLFTAGGRRAWARFVYAIPLVGTLIRSARLAAFTELLAILVDHKFPLPDAFRLAGKASSDPIMAHAAGKLADDLSQGLPLGEVLRGRGLVPEWVTWMAGLGEARGTLGQSLHQVADLYRRQVEMRAAVLRSTLPPFLVVSTAGVFVVFFVVALMLPMIKLLDGLSK